MAVEKSQFFPKIFSTYLFILPFKLLTMPYDNPLNFPNSF